MSSGGDSLDLLFLGSGNAFAAGGRAFSSFLLNGRYLFDCGPTILQQLRKAGVAGSEIEVVFISHFHGDHFFGLPFLLLDGKYGGRSTDLTVIGPPGTEQRTRDLLRLGYPGLVDDAGRFAIRYVEVKDGFRADARGLAFAAARVEHVPDLECFAYSAEFGGRRVVYSGDTTLCEGLLGLAREADVLVLECSAQAVPVHLSPNDIAEVARQAPQAKVILTHVDGQPSRVAGLEGLQVADDLVRFQV